MSNLKSSDIIRHSSNDVSRWEQAIYDAQAEINEIQARVVRLKHAVRCFKELRDKGAPWPGTKDSKELQVVVNDAVKQDTRNARVAEQH